MEVQSLADMCLAHIQLLLNMIIIIIVELIVGFIALRRITKHQAKKFHLHQLSVNIIMENDPKKDI